MPKIEEFNAGDLGLRPSETGVESVAGAARRVNAAYNEAADLKRQTGREFASDITTAGDAATDYIDHAQISHGAYAFSGLQLGLTQEWKDISSKADPNDPTTAQNFLQNRVQPALEQFKSGFLTEKGQAWAEGHTAQFYDHMAKKVTSDTSSRAASAIGSNYDKMAHTYANSVYLDPSHVNLDKTLDNMRGASGAIVGTSPTLQDKPGVKQKLDDKYIPAVVESAVLGAIKQTGQVPDWAKNPKYSQYIDLAQMDKRAETQQRANLVKSKQQQTLQNQQNQQAIKAADDKNFTDNVKANPDGTITVDPKFTQNAIDIATMPGADARTQRAAVNWAESKLNPKKAQTDPQVYSNLLERMTDPDNPTTRTEILEAEAKHQLSTQDGTNARRLYDETEKAPLRDPILKSKLQAAKQLLGTDPIGQQNYAAFLQDFIPQYQQAKRTNQLPPNWGALEDPKSFIGQTLATHQRDQAKMIVDKQLAKSGIINQEGPKFTPPAEWEFSKSRNQYRDPTTKKVYDLKGNEVM